jgi:hypothetical protein
MLCSRPRRLIRIDADQQGVLGLRESQGPGQHAKQRKERSNVHFHNCSNLEETENVGKLLSEGEN